MTYTFTFQCGDDPQTDTATLEINDLQQAEHVACEIFRWHGCDRGHVAIGRRNGDDVEWIGALDFAPGQEPSWKPARG